MIWSVPRSVGWPAGARLPPFGGARSRQYAGLVAPGATRQNLVGLGVGVGRGLGLLAGLTARALIAPKDGLCWSSRIGFDSRLAHMATEIRLQIEIEKGKKR